MKYFKQFLIVSAVFAVLIVSLGAINAFTTSIDNRKTYKHSYRWTGRPKDLLYDWAQEVEDRIEGTTANQSFYFDPTDTEPTASEGRVYYDDSENALKWYNGSSWVTAGTSSSGDSLDTSYNNGNTIDVDGDAVTLTTSDTDNNVVLAIVQNEATNDNGAVTITMGTGATGTGLAINSQTGGTDISGDNWSIDQAGKLTILEIAQTGDVLFNGAATDVAFDASNNQFIIEDSSKLGFGGAHDAAADITFAYDGTGDDLDITFDDKEIAFGSSGAGGDVIFYTETASAFVMIDEDLDDLVLDATNLSIGDGDQILFGDDLGTGDFTISDETDVLTIDNVVDGTGTISIGTSGAGIDVTFHGDAGSATMTWDENQNTNGALVFDNADIEMGDSDFIGFGDTGPDITIAYNGATDDLDILGSGKTVDFGVNDEGMDVIFHGETASANFMWDESANQWLGSGGAQISLNDDVELLFGTGTTNAGDFQIYGSGTGPKLILKAITAGTGSMEIGVDDNDIPIKWFAETASSYVQLTGDQLQINAGQLALADASAILIGNTLGTGDFSIVDTSDVLIIDQVVDGTGAIQFSNDGEGMDITAYANTAGNYLKLDEDQEMWINVGMFHKFDDDAVILIGTGTNVTTADGDFEIESISDTRLNINATAANGQVCVGDGTVASDFLVDNITTAGADFWFDASADTAAGTVYLGVDGKGIDLMLYGETASEYVQWDMSTDTLQSNCGNVALTTTDAEADQFKVDATGTVAGYAIVLETTNGGVQVNADGADNGDISIDAQDDITLTAAGDLTFAVTGTISLGGGILTNQLVTVETDTDNETLTANESGKYFNNNGDADQTIFSLPTAAAGLIYTLTDVEAGAGIDLCIKAAAGDKINNGNAAEYYNCYDDTYGSSVTLVAIDETEWVAVAKVGTWTNDDDTTE